VTPILVDTGFLVALYNRREPMHRRCVEIYKTLEGPFVTCEACITEAFHLLNHVSAAVDGILSSIEQGALEIPFRLGSHAPQVREVMSKYSDTPADFADACLIHLADELHTGDILTLDSDFAHYRWCRNRSFNLLIPLN
jgi:predicted nucleic acid-binding protein